MYLASCVTRNRPPLLQDVDNASALADPLPQAFTLTAIVIGIGIQMFVIALVKKSFENLKTDDLDELRESEQVERD